MPRLRNRIVKADFWGDGEILRWPRDKRMMYQGLWAMAEDSGCLEDDTFEWKLALFRSPMDADITVEHLQQWRDELVDAQKILPYEADGKRYFFLRTFHDHEHPRNPQSPDLPLPPWVKWEQTKVRRADGGRGTEYSTNSYRVVAELLPLANGKVAILPDSNRTVTVPFESVHENQPLSGPVLSSPAPPDAGARARDEAQPVDNLGGGGADSTKNGNGKPPDLDDPVLWELWALPEWQKQPKADAALIAQIRAECPGVSLDAVFADYRLSAGDTKIGQPRRFMLGRAKTLAERAGPEAAPDLVRPEVVARLRAMVAQGDNPKDLRAMCASEAEYAALLGHCSPAKKAVAQ